TTRMNHPGEAKVLPSSSAISFGKLTSIAQEKNQNEIDHNENGSCHQKFVPEGADARCLGRRLSAALRQGKGASPICARLLRVKRAYGDVSLELLGLTGRASGKRSSELVEPGLFEHHCADISSCRDRAIWRAHCPRISSLELELFTGDRAVREIGATL